MQKIHCPTVLQVFEFPSVQCCVEEVPAWLQVPLRLSLLRLSLLWAFLLTSFAGLVLRALYCRNLTLHTLHFPNTGCKNSRTPEKTFQEIAGMNSTVELPSQRSIKVCWIILSTYAPLASALGHHAPKMTPLELRRVAPPIFIRQPFLPAKQAPLR
jgi:hypothetical protein